MTELIKCTTCGEVKPRDEYYTKANGKLRKPCKACIRKGSKAWKDRNKERVTEYDTARYHNNKPYFKQKRRERYLRHRDEELEYMLSWQKNNKEKVRINAKAAVHRRRGRAGALETSSVHFILEHNTEHFSSTNLHCEYCSSVIVDSWELEHVVPISRGGQHNKENLAVSCRSCNRGKDGKHTKLLEEWKPSLQTYINERNQKWKNK